MADLMHCNGGFFMMAMCYLQVQGQDTFEWQLLGRYKGCFQCPAGKLWKGHCGKEVGIGR